MPAEPAAVRAGCLVISYSALTPGQPEGTSLQDVREQMVAMAREWANEHNLSTEGSLVSVQVCAHARVMVMTFSLLYGL